jgi:hypothetical protein
MKSDVKGCSTCPPGQEQYEIFRHGRKMKVQYDYRTPQGKLFSTVSPSLYDARVARDAWLETQEPPVKEKS